MKGVMIIIKKVNKVTQMRKIKITLFILFALTASSICILTLLLSFGQLTQIDILICYFCVVVIAILFIILFFILALPAIQIEKRIQNARIDRDQDMSISSRSELAKLFNYLTTHLREVSEKEYTATLLQKQAQFNELQSQINPHFLYNTLESIRCEMLMIDAVEVADMTESLSLFFRYGIRSSNELATLDDEIENIKHFFKIQQFRFENRFSLGIVFENEVNTSQTYLPKLTLQPIIENSIRHGLEKKVGSGDIILRINTTATLLIIKVSDNGVGIKEAELQEIRRKLNNPNREMKHLANQPNSGSGIALTNVNQRIQLLFGQRYGINISSTYGIGTSVEILLPKNIDNLNIIQES